MAIEVTARHMSATDEIQDYARSKGEQLEEEFPRIEHIHFVLDYEKHRQIATVVVQAKNRIHSEAKESSDAMKTSIDQAFDKVERQMRKLRDKVQDHSAAMKHGEMDKERAL